MIKYTDSMVVFREFPDEITLAINLSLCPNRCEGCHSPYLREDVGEELTKEVLSELVSKNEGITCVGFMGGDNDIATLVSLMRHVKETTGLNCGWYSGRDEMNQEVVKSGVCDYIKIGHYDESRGPIDNPNTNQRLYFLTDIGTGYVDITEQFWNN